VPVPTPVELRYGRAVQPVGIQHVTVAADDLAEAIAFYEGLGMRVVEDRPDFGIEGAWMQCAGEQVHIVVQPGRPAPDAATHFAIIVDDLDACVAELTAAGVTVRPVQHVVGAGRQAFLKDPTGNVIELNQPDRPWRQGS